MATIVYMLADKKMFEQRDQAIVEVATEFFLLVSGLFLQECLRAHDDDELFKISIGLFSSVCAMILTNIVFITYQLIRSCLEKRRRKALEKKRKEALEQAENENKAAKFPVRKTSISNFLLEDVQENYS